MQEIRAYGLVGALLLAVAVLVLLQPKRVGEPESCRTLAESPDQFHGRWVRVSAAGCERLGPRTLVYRRFASDPPAVVANFLSDLPGPPATFTGYASVSTERRPDGREYRVVTLRECYPP